MYCKKCKYHASDHLNACPKCGVSWEEARKSLFLNWLTTGGSPWTVTASDPADAPKPPATSDIFQQGETDDLSLGTDLSVGEVDDFSDDLLLQTLASTQQQLAQKAEEAPLPEIDFSLEDIQHQDDSGAQDSTGTMPELDFSLDTPKVESSTSSSAAPQENPQAAATDALEIDFESLSAEYNATTPPQAAASTTAQKDQARSELEEILSSTVLDELSGTQAHGTAADDIILNLKKPSAS